MSAPDPEPPFPASCTDIVRLVDVDPVRHVRSFVSGDPAGDRLRVAYWVQPATGQLRARAWFGPGAEGPPGHAHGGSLAAVLDEVMGVAAWYQGHKVVAARLTIDYLRPLPLGTDAVVIADVRAVEGRRVTVEGRVEGRVEGAPDVVYTRATGLFVVVEAEMLERFGFGRVAADSKES